MWLLQYLLFTTKWCWEWPATVTEAKWQIYTLFQNIQQANPLGTLKTPCLSFQKFCLLQKIKLKTGFETATIKSGLFLSDPLIIAQHIGQRCKKWRRSNKSNFKWKWFKRKKKESWNTERVYKSSNKKNPNYLLLILPVLP